MRATRASHRYRRPARVGIVAAAIVCGGLLAACGGDDDEATTTSTTRPTSTTTTTAPVGPTLPLTGEPGETPNRPALVVKIDNAPKALPQAGINEADVVIEEAVEGGITRLFVVFHSRDADSVGPVRSARSTDVHLAHLLNRPLFAYSGANAAFERQVNEAPLVNVGHGAAGDLYRRERGRPAPYNLFASTSGLWGRAPADSVPPGPLFQYRRPDQPVAAAGATPTGGARLEFRGRVLTEVVWRWHAESRSWRRTQNGAEHVDAAGHPVAPANVVIRFTPYRDTGFVDQSGEPVPEAELVGEGDLWVLTDGRLVTGRWRQPSLDVPAALLDAEGQPIALTPGRTWMELAKLDSGTAL